jgi:hypothetical protein
MIASVKFETIASDPHEVDRIEGPWRFSIEVIVDYRDDPDLALIEAANEIRQFLAANFRREEKEVKK